MDRPSLFRKHIDRPGLIGIEIGALNRPSLLRDGVEVRYVDHMDTAGLREKYRQDPAVDTARIVDVSYVWQEQKLVDLVGPDTRFDFAIAAHVVEHAPDLIRWLNELHAVLKPGGLLLLLVPDKRFTFDARRRCTELVDVVEAHIDGRRRPSYGQIFGQLSQAATVDVAAAWRGTAAPTDFPLVPGHGPLAGLAACRQVQSTGAYHDVHCNVFTPYSFVELLRALVEAEPGLLKLFRVVELQPTPFDDGEFFVALQAVETPEVEPWTQEVAQRLARAAGYTGAFGGGGFVAAREKDAALKDRYEALVAVWRTTSGDGSVQSTLRSVLDSLPRLDPALHHAPPTRHRRLRAWWQRRLSATG